VLVHGGPYLRDREWEWKDIPQFLASRGYAVIEPEFRGTTGYGFEHFHAGWKQWGQAMQDDVADAVRWAVANKRIDGQRVCIAGGSYGGYSALMGVLRDPDLYRCGAAWAAVSEPRRMLESNWRWADDISDDARRYSLRVLLGDPKDDAEMLKAISPLQQAARIKTPLLLIHGEADRRVPFIHAIEMRDALRRNGQEPEWLTFPEEGHGWVKAENRRAFALKLESFLARHLKGPATPSAK
jgi:dipeptidyl aminopeptidase/acylaminoacyl peptidase